MKKVFALFMVAVGIFTASAQTQNEKSLLWEISGPEGRTSYLFGTYHLLGSDYIKQKPKLDSVYQISKTIVVETVLDSSLLPELSMQSLMQQSIEEMADSADYALLKKELEPLIGAPMSLLNNMKPITLATVLSLQLAQEATPDTFLFEGQPIDLFFAADAKKQNKKLVALETMLEQTEILMNSETVEEQLEGLIYILKEKDETRLMIERTILAYMEQDIPAMFEISEGQADEMGDMTVLIDNRNKNWIPKIRPLLIEGQTFIAVGALHLPGEFGLIELLRSEGFKVKALAIK